MHSLSSIVSPLVRALALVSFLALLGFTSGCTSKCVDGNCVCGPGETCEFTCVSGGCNQDCSEGSDCSATCSGGGCSQNCNNGATCDFACSGGGCAQSCELSDTCISTCSGDGCSTL